MSLYKSFGKLCCMTWKGTSKAAQYSPLTVSVTYEYSKNPLHEERSIGTVPYIKTKSASFMTLNVPHLLRWSYHFFNKTPNTMLHFSSRCEFKNSFEVEIVLLHAQPLARSHIHFLITVVSATYQPNGASVLMPQYWTTVNGLLMAVNRSALFLQWRQFLNYATIGQLHQCARRSCDFCGINKFYLML